MQISRSNLSGVEILALDGRLDASTAPLLQHALEQAWADGCRRIVLHCADLRYVSSAGLQVFLVAGQLAERHAGLLAFSSLRPNVGQIFQMTRFDSLFSIYPDAEAAAAALAASPAEK